jgi:hypothetical protein
MKLISLDEAKTFNSIGLTYWRATIGNVKVKGIKNRLRSESKCNYLFPYNVK